MEFSHSHLAELLIYKIQNLKIPDLNNPTNFQLSANYDTLGCVN